MLYYVIGCVIGNLVFKDEEGNYIDCSHGTMVNNFDHSLKSDSKLFFKLQKISCLPANFFLPMYGRFYPMTPQFFFPIVDFI